MRIPILRIEKTHRKGANLLRAKGLSTESLRVTLAVERHRWAWRPKKVRFILLAESHVFTSDADVRLRIKSTLLPTRYRRQPDGFVRLVYCLGYGESNLVNGKPIRRNAGTWQFWDIFGRLAGTGRQPRGGSKVWKDRLEWKIKTLVRLRKRGIWLVDSSFHALYSPGGVRGYETVKRELHRVWWSEYGKWLIEACKPQGIWTIGRGVHEVLLRLGVPLDDDGWMYQPQAKISTANFERRLKLLCTNAQNVCK